MIFIGTGLLAAFLSMFAAYGPADTPQVADRPVQQGGRFADGRFGKGYVSESKRDRFLIPTAGYLNRDRGTIEMWVRHTLPPDRRPEWGGLFVAQSEPFPKFRGFTPLQLKGLIIQYTEHGKKIFFTLGSLINSSNVLTVSNLNWQAGEDHHLAASWGDDGMHLYIDGREVASNSYTGSLPSLPRLIGLGAYVWDTASDPSKVVIDDLRISDTQRSPAQIQATYQSGRPAVADNHTLLLMSFDQPPARGSISAASTAASGAPSPAPAAASGPTMAGGKLVPGRSGKGYVTERPGDVLLFPAAGNIRLERGTVEMWLKPTLPPSQRPEWAALFSMLDENYSTSNIRGLIITYVDYCKRIAFVDGKLGDGKVMLASPELNWQAGENHHLAFSWGDQGMKLYLDGKRVAQNGYKNPPLQALPAQFAVGSHTWDLIRRPSFTVIDDLMISDVQKSDDEIQRDASSSQPASRRGNTLLAVSFDDDLVRMPLVLVGSRPFNLFRPGEEVVLTVPADRLPAAMRKDVPVSVRGDGGDWRTQPADWTSQGLQLRFGRADLGYHALDVRVADLPSIKSYFWVAPDLPNQDARQSIFGIGQHEAKSMDDTFFRAAQALGVKWLRLSFDWKTIEPQRGKNNWELYDRITRLARQYDVHLLGTLFWEEPVPEWQGKSLAGTNKYPPTDMNAWAEHVRRVVARYRDSVDAWDPWNEPNMPGYWHPKPDPQAYVHLLQVTHDAIKAADPNALVVGCGLSEIELKFYEDCFKLGALRYSDVIAVHPYMFPSSPDDVTDVANIGGIIKLGPPLRTDYFDGMTRLHNLVTQYGGSQRIWVTELGQHSGLIAGLLPPGTEVSEQKQAEYMVKFFVESQGTGFVDHLFWFSFWGTGAGPFAILRDDGSPTPAAVAYRTLVGSLGGGRFVRRERLGDTLKVYQFDVSGKKVSVVWTTRGTARVAVQSAGALRALNLLGRLQSGDRAGARTTFSVTQEPLILEGAASVSLD